MQTVRRAPKFFQRRPGDVGRGTISMMLDDGAGRRACLLSEGTADMIVFGRAYIANPDLVERLASGTPLAEVYWSTVYASHSRGYTDYPRFAIRRRLEI